MKKYPLSKKAIAIALATALAMTPFATLSGDLGAQTVHAETVASSSDLADKVTEVYEEFLAADDESGSNEDALQDIVKTLSSLSPEDWKKILTNDVYDKMQEKLPESEGLDSLLNDMVGLFKAGDDAFADRLDNFVKDHSASFDKLFDVSVKEFIQLLEAIIDGLDDYTMDFSEYDDYTELSMANLVSEILDYLDQLNNSTYNQMKDDLNGYGMNRTMAEDAGVALLGKSGEDTSTVAEVVTALLTAMDVDLQFDEGNGNGGPGPGIPDPQTDPEPVEDEETEVDEEDNTVTVGRDVTTVERTQDAETGRTNVRITVNADSLAESLAEQEDVRELRLNVTRGDDEDVEVDIPSNALQTVKDRNPEARVTIESNDGSISVPSSQIDTDQLRTSLGGADDEEVTVSFRTNRSSDDTNILGTNNLTSRSQVVSFNVSARIGENRIDLSRFTRPIERSIPSLDGDFADGTTLVVRLNDDDTVSPVPTRVAGDRANFKGYSNSRYVAIESDVSFDDIDEEYWAYANIDKLSNQRIILGFEDGNFRPTEDLTRGQFTAMLVRSLGLTSDGYDDEFTDVTADYRFADDLAVAYEYDLIAGFLDGEFKPELEIDRESVAALLSRATAVMDVDFELDEDVSADQFVDSNEIAAFAYEHVDFLRQADILRGNTNGTVRPKDHTSRSETAALLDRFLVQAEFLNE